nr:hypothetical protein [Tanacetum cinerariifolium]
MTKHFMKSLRSSNNEAYKKLVSQNYHEGRECIDDEDAHEHVWRVLEITDLFHILGVTRDTKLQENMHAIQVGCKIREKVHLTNVRSLKDDDKVGEQGKTKKLTHEILTSSMADKAKTKMIGEMKVKKELVSFDLPNVNPYDESTMPPIPFPRHLKEQKEEAQAFRMLKGLKRLKINRSLIRVVKKLSEYLMYVKEVFVGFKGLHGVTTAQLVLLVYKVIVVFNKVNAAKSRVTTAIRVFTDGWINRLEDQDMRVNEIY